jgi:predicted nucleotidyltransferase
MPSGLPSTVETAIDGFASALRTVFGADLVSIVLFGSAAEAKLRATSDVNLVVVLRRADPALLVAIGDAYRLAHAAIRLSAMFILETEIPAASEAFAVKFADIVVRHRVLHGPDPFEGLVVDREAARRRLHQVLVNLTLRLRERLALSGPYPEQLVLAAADAVGPLRACAAILQSLGAGGPPGAAEALADLARRAGREAELDRLIEARRTGTVPDGMAVACLEGAIELARLIETRAAGLA